MEAGLANEELILGEIVAGNQHAFTLLYRHYHQKVYGFAFQVLKDQAQAEELVQEVFMKLWMRREHLAEVHNFGAYLAVFCRNETLNAIKKSTIQQKHYQVVQTIRSELDCNTEDAIRLHETQKLLGRAVERLSPQQQNVYKLLNADGLKLHDVAKRLNITPSTAKTHLKLALKNIRSFLVVHYRTLGTVAFILHKIL